MKKKLFQFDVNRNFNNSNSVKSFFVASLFNFLKNTIVVCNATLACSRSLSSAILIRTNRLTPFAPPTR